MTTPERSITLKDHTTKYDFIVTFEIGGPGENRTHIRLIANQSRLALEHASPYKLVGIEGLEPPRISPRASKTRVSAISPYAR